MSGGPAIYTVTVNPAAAGNVSLSLPSGAAQDTDSNGNIASNQLDIMYQVGSAPTAALSGSASTGGSYTVSIAFSETVTGLTTSDFFVSNGNASNLSGSGANYSVVITPCYG